MPEFSCADEVLAQRVLEAIWSHPWLTPTDVDVRVEDGVVVLGGQIATTMDIAMIEGVLAALPGVEDVENQLRVLATERLAQAA
jgi:osmotically-inducible protein OsmY